MKTRYFSLYVTDSELIKFLEDLKGRNRNRFIVEVLRVAKSFQDEMAKALGSVEASPLKATQRTKLQPLNQDQLLQAMNDSLKNWRSSRTSVE